MRKATNMNPSEALKAVEEKMNNALLTHSQRSWSDTELEKCLIDELRDLTIDFLELRGQVRIREASKVENGTSLPANA